MLGRVRQLTELLITPHDRPLKGAEIGVYKGEMSAGLMEAFPNLWLLMVDPWVPYDGKDWTGSLDCSQFGAVKEDALKNVKPYFPRYCVLNQASPACSLLVPDESLDFVFVDGNHKEEYVYSDLVAWFPKVRKGGLMSGHDITRSDSQDGVRISVDRFFEGCYDTGLDATWWVWKT